MRIPLVLVLLALGTMASFAPAAQSTLVTQPVPEALRHAESQHTRVYRSFGPAVVGLECKGSIRLPNGGMQQGTYYGTGAVITADGLILTSITVIPKDATDLKVYFTDGHVRVAQLKASDLDSEGVLLKVEARDLTHMRLADSDRYAVGSPVYSWGNPHFTIKNDGQVSLSTGTISGRYQVASVDDQSRYVGPVIETDAAVNPGSDGGPLTDAEGNLIGIMSLAFSRTRWLGLAIPTRRMIQAIPDLQKVKLAEPPRLTGDLQRVWALHAAFKELSVQAEPAVVTVVVMDESKAAEWPASRDREADKPRDPIAQQGNIRALAELTPQQPAVFSGFVVEASGTVVTTSLPFQPRPPQDKRPAPKLKTFVYFASGKRLEAKLLGFDAGYDLAVLQLLGDAGATYPSAKLASAAKLTQGRAVAILGRSEPPGGLTLNSGWVSAAGRSRNTSCQVAALMNYGNLGGAVIDLDGSFVGMACKLNPGTPWRQNCGVGFMLNAETIAQALPMLKEGKPVDRPRLPFLGVGLDRDAPNVKGARVEQSLEGGPAQAAGIRVGDVIVEFNGKPVASFLELIAMIKDCKIGQQVKVQLLRGEEKLALDVTVGERE